MASGWQDLGQGITAAVVQEFSDLPDMAQFTRVVLRLFVAALLGGLLGWEREQKGQAAGVRTHMLVAMGAALFVLMPQQAGMDNSDISRIIQGLTAGIGFLGAGTIIKGSRQSDVKGLTTAAGVWLTAAIGVSAGLGRETTAVVGTVMALLILSVIPLLIRQQPNAVNVEQTEVDAEEETGSGSATVPKIQGAPRRGKKTRP